MKIAVLISGRGSNLRSLIDCQEAYQITGVVSSVPDAPGLAFAVKAAIPTHRFDRMDFGSIVEYKAAIRERVVELDVDLIVLAGYMVILENEFIEAMRGRIVNIHPSLLPKYPGLRTHERVIAAGEKEHGATVHRVIPAVDEGPIIAQVKIPVRDGETPETVEQRILIEEQRLYPWVVNAIGRGEILLKEEGIYVSSSAKTEARKMGFLLSTTRGRKATGDLSASHGAL